MNAEIKPIRTAAETALVDAFAAFKAKTSGGKLREDAFRRFEAAGLPTRRVEEWKYTDLRAAMQEAKPLAGPPGAAAKARGKEAGKLLAGIEARRLLFIDGAFVPELSDLAGLEQGLSIRSTAEALAAGDPLLGAHLGKVVTSDDVALALNTAFMGDGALISIGKGVALSRPLHLVFVTASKKPVAIFPRSLVVLGEGAGVTLLESHEGPDGCDYQVNAALELVIGDNASLDYVKAITEGDKALHVATLLAAIGAKAKVNTFAFTTGGAVVRNQLFVRFDGEDTKAGIRGASMLKGRQHVDSTLVIDHAKGHCESRELFKSVLDGESRGVFQGKIIVRPHAQKTDGKMMTQALLLSEKAEADNKPELEIFADDVVCGHGATAGAIDEELKFYLMARGIPAKEAEALLIQAFAGEAIEEIAHEGVREALMNAAIDWLGARA
jgi:Fe-S cluster assembly protein SufD